MNTCKQFLWWCYNDESVNNDNEWFCYKKSYVRICDDVYVVSKYLPFSIKNCDITKKSMSHLSGFLESDEQWIIFEKSLWTKADFFIFRPLPDN